MDSTYGTVSAAQRPASAGRSFLLLVAGAAVLLIAGVLVAVIASRSSETVYPAGTPQHAVATYLRLLQTGNVDRAYGMTAFRSHDPSRAEFHQIWDGWSSSSHRVVLVRMRESGGTAAVTVDATSFAADPFGSEDQTNRVTFTLVQRGRSWLITGPAYPYMP